MASTARLTEAHRRELEEALSRYLADDPEELGKENRLLQELPPRFQAAGRIDRKEDFIEIVRWKASRQTGHAADNSAAKIRKVTEGAFASASKGQVVEAVDSLRAPALAGVGTRVATAILLFFDSNRFTVLDKLAWRSLVHLRVLDAFECWFEEPEDFPHYLDACHQLASWFRHNLRKTDRALWQLASDGGGTNV